MDHLKRRSIYNNFQLHKYFPSKQFLDLRAGNFFACYNMFALSGHELLSILLRTHEKRYRRRSYITQQNPSTKIAVLFDNHPIKILKCWLPGKCFAWAKGCYYNDHLLPFTFWPIFPGNYAANCQNRNSNFLSKFVLFK